MLTAALTTIKNIFGISTNVREGSNRPLEEESGNEFEEIIASHSSEPQRKKRCSRVDRPLAQNTDTRLNPAVMQFPWLTWRKEENPNPLPDVKDEFEVLERREITNVNEIAKCRPPLGCSPIGDFRFVPTNMESNVPAKQSSRDSNCLKSLRSHNSYISSKRKYNFKGHPSRVLDRLLGKRRSTGIFTSRMKYSVMQKSFLHEEKMKYQQLLQQYTEHYFTPNSNSNTLMQNVTSFSSSPVRMVTRSQWTHQRTKQKQDQIENESSASSSCRPFPSAHNSGLEEIFGSSKIVCLEGSTGRYQKQEKSKSISVPLIDISKEDNEEENTCDKESDGDSVIMIKEVASPQAQRNSLEERLKEHPLYDLDWVKSMQKEYEERAHNAKKDADTTSKLLHELEQKRNKKVSLHEKVTEGLKLLDLTYPSKYIEIPDQEEEEEAFVPLTTEMENEIDDALKKTPKSEVLIERFHIRITCQDIRTLNGLNWLNDEVINFYMNLIMERSQKNDNYPSVYAFNTFFYPKLSKIGYQSVRRWTKKVDVFSYDLLLVPIHLGMHWCMSVVDFKMKCINYYDSMLGNNEWCLQCLLEYLEAEHQDKKGSPYNTSIWKLKNKKDIPQQMNGSDCGMFACKFADYLSRRARINFDQQHMPYFRRRMVYEIINAKLL